MPGDLSLCYTCGQEEPTHHIMCPDYWGNRVHRLSPFSQPDSNLIPIGTYYYDFIDGRRLRRDIEG